MSYNVQSANQQVVRLCLTRRKHFVLYTMHNSPISNASYNSLSIYTSINVLTLTVVANLPGGTLALVPTIGQLADAPILARVGEAGMVD